MWIGIVVDNYFIVLALVNISQLLHLPCLEFSPKYGEKKAYTNYPPRNYSRPVQITIKNK